MNGMEKLREYADVTKRGRECRILHAHHGDFAGECSERECDDCRAAYLRAIADEIERDRADSPKVLDADGEPLEVGQTVWRTTDGTTAAVERLNGATGFIDSDGTPFEARYFTHQRPVLDANGEPINVGDEVWNLTGGGPYTVTEVDRDHMHVGVTRNTHDGRLDWGFEAAFLTHAKPEPPDTWARIEEDATLSPREYYARHVGHDVGLKDDEEVNGAFGKSLVRRCRALAEKEAVR